MTKQQITLRLRDGTSVDGLLALAAMGYLRYVLDGPDGQRKIEALQRLGQGQRSQVPDEVVDFFKSQLGVLDPTTLEPRPLFTMLLANAIRKVPDGIVLVEPYERSPDNLDAFTRANRRGDANVQRFIRKLDADDQRDDTGGRPSR